MASKAFQDRFRNRSSQIPSHGDILLSPKNPVEKAPNFKLHLPIPKSLAKLPLKIPQKSFSPTPAQKSFYSSPSLKSAKNQPYPKSQTPLHYSKNHRSVCDPNIEKKYHSRQNTPDKRLIFSPYSLSEYKNTNIGKYFELGGLGSGCIGSENWMKKKQLYNKRKNYLKGVGRKIPVCLLTPIRYAERFVAKKLEHNKSDIIES